MNKVNDQVFGELIDNGGWSRKELVSFWGIQKEVDIIVYGDDTAEFDDSQKESFIEFKNLTDKFVREAEISAYEHYLSILKELRGMFEEDADKLAPILSGENEFVKLVNPTTILFPFIFRDDIKTKFGILFDCTWDPGHGLAVVFINGKVSVVGEQDIIL